MFVSRATRLHWHMFAIRTHTHIHKTLLNRYVPNHKSQILWMCAQSELCYLLTYRIEPYFNENIFEHLWYQQCLMNNERSTKLQFNICVVLLVFFSHTIRLFLHPEKQFSREKRQNETKRKATNAHTHSYRSVNKQKKKKKFGKRHPMY